MALMTIAQAAKETGLKEPTIRKMVSSRRLDSVKLGRAVRIPEEAIRKLIERSTIPALERR
jgi:excisionase family DNA binding protein